MKIKILEEQELDLLFLHSKEEGWHNEELHTRALYKAHPNDFFIAYKKKKLIGFILAIKHYENFGFVSSFLVLKKYRSLGYGKKKFEHVLKHLHGCQIALDSVEDKQDFYKVYGFKAYFDVINYVFTTGSVTLEKLPHKTIGFNSNISLKNQSKYMKNLLLSEGISYRAIKKEDSISSFAFIFKYIDGYKIHIDSNEINEALTLFFALTNRLEIGTKIYVQVSQLAPIQEAIVELLEMEQESKYVRMYNKIID